MMFKELSDDAKTAARSALAKVVAELGGNANLLDYEKAGEKVAAAFIEMERFNSAPDVCMD